MKEKSSPLISIIVPVYQVEQYLDKCVQSILHQSYKNIEIILVDDGSPDNCPAMCDEYASRDSRIKVIHKTNGGLSSARNAGVEAAQGEFVGFVDSDDWLPSNSIEILASFTSFSRVGVIGGMATYIREGKINTPWMKCWINEFRNLKPQKFLKYVLSEDVFSSVWTKIFRRDLIAKVPFYEGITNEDVRFLYEVGKEMCKKDIIYVEVPQSVYFYRYNPNSITNGDKKLNCFRDVVINSYYFYEDSKTLEIYGINALAKKRYHSHLVGYSLLLCNNAKQLPSKMSVEIRRIKWTFMYSKWGIRHFIGTLLLVIFPRLLRCNCVFDFVTRHGIFPPINY